MHGDERERTRAYDRKAAEIERQLGEGRNLAMVTLGDPLFFSTAGYLLTALEDRVAPEHRTVYPGITSPQAAAAWLGRPLVQRDESYAVVPAHRGIDRMDDLLELHEAVVLLKIHSTFPTLYESLSRNNCLSRGVLFEHLGRTNAEHRRLDRVPPDHEPPYMSLLILYPDRVKL